jgi:hypothetical protein
LSISPKIPGLDSILTLILIQNLKVYYLDNETFVNE